jgi:hypothetical protein
LGGISGGVEIRHAGETAKGEKNVRKIRDRTAERFLIPQIAQNQSAAEAKTAIGDYSNS